MPVSGFVEFVAGSIKLLFAIMSTQDARQNLRFGDDLPANGLHMDKRDEP